MFDKKTPDVSPLADFAGQASHTADQALQSTRKHVNQAVSDTMESLRHRTAPLIQGSVDRFHDASDCTVRYIKDKPVKSVLIAVAAGAVLMAVSSLLARNRD